MQTPSKVKEGVSDRPLQMQTLSSQALNPFSLDRTSHNMVGAQAQPEDITKTTTTTKEPRARVMATINMAPSKPVIINIKEATTKATTTKLASIKAIVSTHRHIFVHTKFSIPVCHLPPQI